MLEFLKDQPVSVEKKTGGRTPLLEACWNGHATTVDILISAGSDVNAKDEDDFSCMHAAAHRGYTEILDLLLRHGANIEALDDGRSTPFAMAALNFSRSSMRLLAERGANVSPVPIGGVSPLKLACTLANVEKVRLLLQLGANPKTCLLQIMRDMWKSPSPNDAAAAVLAGVQPPGCARGRLLDIAEMVIAAGDDLELRQPHGPPQSCEHCTPLHFAAGIVSRRLVASLLRAGAVTYGHGRTAGGVVCTPLSWAAACSRPAAAHLLLQAGALESTVDERGRLPLQAVGIYVPSLPPAPEEEVERRAAAVAHALLRGPAFRATSFLWPASSAPVRKAGEAKRRPLALRRCCGRRERTPVALSAVWRCVL